MYITQTYVMIGGRLCGPGEIIERDDNAEWHLEAGAIRPFEAEAPRPASAGAAGAEDAAGEAEDAGGEPEYEEPEPPQIDAADALVTAAEAPKKRRGKGGTTK